jgi:3-hydroxy-3-methylglutaryl CoA synthase
MYPFQRTEKVLSVRKNYLYKVPGLWQNYSKKLGRKVQKFNRYVSEIFY